MGTRWPSSTQTTLSLKERDRRWLMRTGVHSAKQIYNGIEGKEWEEVYCHYRDVSKATDAKKPSESQNAKAFW